jgi:prenyltransferase beta subunit
MLRFKTENIKSAGVLFFCLLLFFLIFFSCVNHSGNDTIDEILIYQSAERAVNYLRGLQHDNGQIILDDDEMFNVWETIEAVRAISLWQDETNLKEDQVIQSAIAFLKDSETSFGMVLHSSNHQNSYCVETSSVYIELLAFLESKGATEQHGAAREKALYIRSEQLSSGAWRAESFPIPENLQQFPSVTGFALGALASVDIVPLYLDAALLYLRESQNEEGHWGFVWQAYGTPYYPMMPILKAIHNHNTDNSFDSVINKARVFLLESQSENGSLSYGSENGPSVELETILGLRALRSCDVGFDDASIKKGIDWLLSIQREDGSWDGGLFPFPGNIFEKEEDIFCTSQVLIFLYEYIKERE